MHPVDLLHCIPGASLFFLINCYLWGSFFFPPRYGCLKEFFQLFAKFAVLFKTVFRNSKFAYLGIDGVSRLFEIVDL